MYGEHKRRMPLDQHRVDRVRGIRNIAVAIHGLKEEIIITPAPGFRELLVTMVVIPQTGTTILTIEGG